MRIISGGLERPEVVALLQQHLDEMALHSPPESIHALDPDALKVPQISFFSAWDEQQLMGCAALKALNAAHGEIKSMRTSTQYRRRGVAAALLEHMIALAAQRQYQALWLETGSMDVFAPARKMYGTFGFVECEPFADYVRDPNSVFMTLDLPH
ncbi:MAG: GNAT family N-acetyltransferase [Pseudomonadota bacterium]